jgi:3-hydroxyisobutyrate dehydrogenase
MADEKAELFGAATGSSGGDGIMRVSFLGLGVMGFPMAGHLKRAGYDVTVFNRTRAKADAWVKDYGGVSAPSPAEAAANADVVLSCVGRDDDVREVALGRHGAFITMKRDAVFIDHTTASAGLARELAESAHQRGMHFVDAPVSGGEQGAKNGQLTIMCGGTPTAYAKAEPVISTYARQCRLMGEAGAGQLTKMVNQICIAGLVQALSEGLSFARAAGLDPLGVVEVISKGAAQSWQMENRHKTMLDGKFEHGFAVEWMRKDLAICLEEARRNGTSLPVTALVDQFYAEVENMGGKRWDTSSLFARQQAFKKGT